MIKKIGIYSGTFDPVHKGHVSFSLEAVEKYGLDKVYFLVEPRPRRKQGVKALEHRVNMVKLAVKKHQSLGTVIIDQARFTARETMPVILSRFKGAEIYMLVGDDILNHIADWPHVDELTRSVNFVIGARKKNPEDIKMIINKLAITKGVDIKSRVFTPDGARFSSSRIKKNLKVDRGADSVDGLEPQVLDYIKKNNLYFAVIE